MVLLPRLARRLNSPAIATVLALVLIAVGILGMATDDIRTGYAVLVLIVGLINLIFFMAALSVNLGLINLFPVPMLDGGHLMFYAIEAIRGKPMSHRVLEYCFRFGVAVVLLLMVFATWNDIVNLKVIEFFKQLVS